MGISKSLTYECSKATEEARQALVIISNQAIAIAILDLNTQVATATEEQSSV